MVGFELAAHIICDPRLRRGVVVVVVVRAAAAIIALGLLRWSQRRRQPPPPPLGPGRLCDKDHNFKFITVLSVWAPAGRSIATAEMKKTFLTSWTFLLFWKKHNQTFNGVMS